MRWEYVLSLPVVAGLALPTALDSLASAFGGGIHVLSYDIPTQETSFLFLASRCMGSNNSALIPVPSISDYLQFTLRPDACLQCNDIWLNERRLEIKYGTDGDRSQYQRMTYIPALDGRGVNHTIQITFYSSNNNIIGGWDPYHLDRRFVVPNPNERFEIVVGAVDGRMCNYPDAFHFRLLLDDPLRRLHNLGLGIESEAPGDIDFTRYKKSFGQRTWGCVFANTKAVVGLLGLLVLLYKYLQRRRELLAKGLSLSDAQSWPTKKERKS
ncbi:hypothetical protein CAC42_68 [Sphaceloma murrayae]|uniref:Uncharacterized protein n=1 Tax=Sphaceloma murrayae TaxID=2082308 RepID=A0A2K1QN63_9PEZI|nr:hypothetical protein CAC42_68 [Sphaceloma murrayae]